ncbi:MAG TPA: hypothetical protein PLY93_08015 [Turneriella sp.]|nr:hypothetical protein [Turneriella sp.]
MIYYHTTHPTRVAGKSLDNGLAHGWYRIGQSFSTTDLIVVQEQLLPVFWLRIDLKRYTPSRSARRILKKNQDFSVAILPFKITPEIENLFAAYRAGIDFSMSETVAEYLLDNEQYNAYDTYLIEVRDKDRLVAVGYFDVGKKTNTGILHFYDHALGDFSLGKFLFLLELEYGLTHGFDYYYMGYLCKGDTKFDYKLFADRNSTEVYLRALNRWLPYNAMDKKISRWGEKIIDTCRRSYRLVPTEEQ